MDDQDNWLQIAINAHLAKQHGEDERDFLESAALMLERALPAQTQIERGGAFWSRARPVKRLVVALGEQEFGLENGAPLRATVARRVHGVVLKTEAVSTADWIARLSAALGERAQQSREARAALEKWLA